MRNRQRIGAIILALFSVFFLFGCQETELTIKKVELDPTVDLSDVELADFELSDLSLIITFSDDSTENVSVTASMLASSDVTKLTFMGSHTFIITYEGFEVEVTLSLTDSVTLTNLQTYYQYAVDTLGFDGTYDAWISSLLSGSSETIIKAEFNTQNEFVITFSNMQTQNLGLMSNTLFTVNFYDYYGELITSVQVPLGGTATPPIAPVVLEYTFTGWDQTFDDVQSNLEIHAIYTYSGTPIGDIEDADELILSLTRLQEAQFGVNLDAIFSQTNSTQAVKRSRNTYDIYGDAVVMDTSDGFDPSEFIPHNYWNHMFYHQGLYQQPQVLNGYQVITSTLTTFSSHALNNLYEVNTSVTDHARERADWAVDYITVMDTWVDFGDYLYLLHYDEELDRVELYTIWTNETHGVTSYERIYVYYNQNGEEVVESWVEQIYEDTSTYPGVMGYHNSIAGRDFNYYAIWLDENYQPTSQRHYRGINLNDEGEYEYYDGSTSMISGEYGWYTVYPGIDDERELLYYPDKPIVTVYSPDASSDVFRITPMFEVGYNVEVYLPSMRGVEALLVEDGGMISQNQDSTEVQQMIIDQGFTLMPDWWALDPSNPDLITGFKTANGTFYADAIPNGQDVTLNRLNIEIGSEGLRDYDLYYNYFGTATLYVNATNLDELVSMLTTYFNTVGLTYKYGNTAELFMEVAEIFEHYEAIGRKISIVNDIAPMSVETYASYQSYVDTHAFITSYLSIRETLLGMQSTFSVIDQTEMPSKDDLNKITLIDTASNLSGSLQADGQQMLTSGITATLKRSPLLQQGKSYALYYALQVGGTFILLGHETPLAFSGQDLTFTGNQTLVIPEDLVVGDYELVTFFGKVVEDSYLRISNPLSLTVNGLDAYHITTPDDVFEMATDTFVYLDQNGLKVSVTNIDIYPPKVKLETSELIYQGEVAIDEWMMPLGSTVQDLVDQLSMTDNFDGLITPNLSMIQKDGVAVTATDLLTETGWTITVMDANGNMTKITFTKISFGYTVTWMWDEEVIGEMIVKPGETVTPLQPEKSGYTFTGWDTVDFTINEDRIIHAIYTVNTYTITWMYNDQVYQVDQNIPFGSEIVPPVMDTMEGYSFRWNLDGTTMPATDLVISGSYIQHEYYITYYLDGIYYGSQVYHIGDTIDYLVPNVEEGMVFSGWDISYEVMPGSHLDAHGTTSPANPS
ncbi:MAG: hypothetical protein A2Y45_08120 [Tenericutes bacterium GWC2_34_14]|nr:MAG: hypothetical protein A2Y45_08120 [Tenericutes bacterium GWC2_34_14]OHE34842.1 MAG: hypothetical protein A2012_01730 [Tenericutes bacterium GWE2_34_108]OHE37297.1 MAG: hypothetical protein A2Y46_01280 [Tenericutes bacterium GWF1_35_14]OHE39570.1 MAG: hypothetical protein A2Y44_01580 [Tenericutes bacterium GWF2_35_184]OHE43162.1 MAG: hypothetical protein A3K26_03025 [Tenericutes bacterium RIFOXYA12_FULL_35_10]OHE44241.1 MAG: hypothetical protein A2221_03930 [Tenericutes bacterium RIFOXYA